MKTLKFGPPQVKALLEGDLQETWRINDDKDLSVNDEVEFIDKKSGKAIGTAIINEVLAKRYGEIAADDQEVLLTLQTYYGKDIDPDVVVKAIRFNFTPYPHPQVKEESGAYVHIPKLKLYADGGSRGNPGPSASGYVLLDMDGSIVKKSGTYLGITTNNQAEYHALKVGLEEAKKFGAEEVDVYLDSLLVVNQMKGIFKVKNRDLWPVHQAIKDLVATFKKVNFTHVPRELNKLADAEVNETLDTVAKQ